MSIIPLFSTSDLCPISDDRLKQILMRLTLHFKCPPGERAHQVYQRYKAALMHYPDDLLSAAYLHIVKYATDNMLPPLSQFVAFIEPEYNRRKLVVSEAAHESA